MIQRIKESVTFALNNLSIVNQKQQLVNCLVLEKVDRV